MKVLTSNIASVIERCKRAVSNIAANEEKHSVNKHDSVIVKMFDVADYGNRILSLKEEAEIAYSELAPSIREKLEANAAIVTRGYFVTHRFAANGLPHNLRWTVVGTDLVNKILSEIAITAPYMAMWVDEIQRHRNEMEQREHERVTRMTAFALENADQRRIMGDEIVRLIRERNDIVRNYGRLFNHLKSGLGSGFRGSRGVGVIHDAMREKLKWAPHWEKFMEVDMAHAKEHDARVRTERRANDRSRKLYLRQSNNQNTQA